MKTALVSLLAFGVADIINPSGITIVLLLLTMVKKKSHVIAFLASSYVSYALCGIAMYLGASRWVTKWLEWIKERWPQEISVITFLLGILFILGGVASAAYYLWGRKKEPQGGESHKNRIQIKSVNIGAIILFATTVSIVESPNCVTLLAYIGILAASDLPFLIACLLLFVFSLFAMTIPFGIFILSCLVPEDMYQRVIVRLKRFCEVAACVLLPVFLVGFGVFLLIRT